MSGFWDTAGRIGLGGLTLGGSEVIRAQPGGAAGFFGVGSGDPSNPYRNALQANAQALGGFGGQWGNAYNANQAGINNTLGQFQNLANGQDSVSMEQARQNMAQAQAQQMSMAAGASPQNAAMAQRQAMMNSGNLAAGISGQQVLAGLQERQAALNAMAQLQAQQAQMNMTGALGAYGSANQAYGQNMGTPQQSWWKNVFAPLAAGAAQGAGKSIGGMG
jgi:hypothetical protein